MKAVISVILAGVLWGVINIFVKALARAGFDSLQISGIRMIVAAVIFTLVVFIKDRSLLKIRLRDIWMFIGTGIISVVFFNACYFYTMIHGQASVAVVLLYTSPIFIMILSAFLFKERITRKKILALILTFCGCVLVAGLLGGDYTLSPLIILTGIGSGFFYALYTIFGRYALAKYDTVTLTVYTFIFGLIGSIPLGRFREGFDIIKADPSVIFWCLGIGIISTILPYFFYTWGLQRMEAGKAAILVAVEPVVGALIGMTVFNESRNAVKIIGICLIIGAIIILNTGDKGAENGSV